MSPVMFGSMNCSKAVPLPLYSHYTQTTTWTDPRSLTPIPFQEFEWNALPQGWERYLDEHGDIYYVKSVSQ